MKKASRNEYEKKQSGGKERSHDLAEARAYRSSEVATPRSSGWIT